MIKRQYYTLLHPNHHRDDVSASSSSESSSSDSSALSGEAGFKDEDASWPASSHESDSSLDKDESSEEEATPKSRRKEAKLDNEQNEKISFTKDQNKMSSIKNFGKKKNDIGNKMLKDQWEEVVEETEREKDEDLLEESMVVHIGGVLKCKLCPKRLILSEEQLTAHLHSKGHARSLKLFKEGQLKRFLNSDGEEEEEAETHAERHARIMAVEKSRNVEKKRGGGRQCQRKRAKRKALLDAGPGKDVKEAYSERYAKSKRKS